MRTALLYLGLATLLIAPAAAQTITPSKSTKTGITKPAAVPTTAPAAAKDAPQPKAVAGPAEAKGPAAEPAKELAEPTYPKEVPDTLGGAVTQGSDLVEKAKTKQWFAFSAGIIWLIMFLVKWGRKNLAFMQAIPKRALWVILPVLSIAALVLAKFQGDLSWASAIDVGTSGPLMAYLNDFFKRGVMGKEPSSTVREGALIIPEWAKDK